MEKEKKIKSGRNKWRGWHTARKHGLHRRSSHSGCIPYPDEKIPNYIIHSFMLNMSYSHPSCHIILLPHAQHHAQCYRRFLWRTVRLLPYGPPRHLWRWVQSCQHGCYGKKRVKVSDGEIENSALNGRSHMDKDGEEEQFASLIGAYGVTVQITNGLDWKWGRRKEGDEW